MNFIKKSLVVLSLIVAVFTQNSLVANDALSSQSKIKVIAEKLMFTEGPLWLSDKQSLIFSDVRANKQYIWSEKNGLKVFRDPSDFSNGNMLDSDGNIVTVQHNRTVTRTLKNGKREVIASLYNGKKLNSPNDLVLYKDGSIYFTDPPFGLRGTNKKEEQEYRGIYRLTKKGEIARVGQELGIPNGVAFSPDFTKLYVTNSVDGNIYLYDVTKNGNLKNLRIFVKQLVPKNKKAIGDGIKVDKNGNIFAASSVGVSVYSSKGIHLGDIKLEKPATNLTFGETEKVLFITARDKVYKIDNLILKKQ
jgi:gluconolactonase